MATVWKAMYTHSVNGRVTPQSPTLSTTSRTPSLAINASYKPQILNSYERPPWFFIKINNHFLNIITIILVGTKNKEYVEKGETRPPDQNSLQHNLKPQPSLSRRPNGPTASKDQGNTYNQTSMHITRPKIVKVHNQVIYTIIYFCLLSKVKPV